MTEQGKTYWSEGGQIFFCDGKGYGVTERLQNICLGGERDINKFLKTGELNEKLNPAQRQVLAKIAEYRKEESIGIREDSVVRTGNNGTIGGKPKTIKATSPRKRLALRSSHKKHQSLHRR